MGTYKEIRGTHIVSVTSDPPSPVNGQMWYNSSEKVVKGFTSNPTGTWSSGGSMNTAREKLTGCGARTAALAIGGEIPSTLYGRTENYNGSSWTEVNDLNTARSQLRAGGNSTSSLVFGGRTPGNTAITESWNGSSWTEVSDLNTARQRHAGAGADNTSSIAIGGVDPAGPALGVTETWNGSSWTEVNDLNTARYDIAGNGIVTAALAYGGQSPNPVQANTESWNGSSWTEVNDLNTAKKQMASSEEGAYTATIVFGGVDEAPGSAVRTAKTELWNGTSWAETTDLSLARSNLGGAGTSTAGIAFAGDTGPAPMQSVSEEFTAPVTSTVTFTTS